MTLYNVKASVVELVEAPTPQDAINTLINKIDRAGLCFYEGEAPDAYESEPIHD